MASVARSDDNHCRERTFRRRPEIIGKIGKVAVVCSKSKIISPCGKNAVCNFANDAMSFPNEGYPH